ncbi:MAG: roadblock/LC7 domain-containing protein [Gaiellaceae bacterium]
MDAKQALADLAEISSQIRAAVLCDAKGAVLGSTLADEARAKELASAAAALLEAAARTRRQTAPDALTQLEAATLEGSVFVVRDHDRVIAATTSPEPTVGLVFYDLKSCLRNVEGKAASAPRARRKLESPGEEAGQKAGPGERAAGTGDDAAP